MTGRGWGLLLLLAATGPVLAEVTLTTRVELLAPAAAEAVETGVLPGDVLLYTIAFSNTGTRDAAAGSIVITNPLPENTRYIEGSAAGADTIISFSVDGELFAAPEELQVTDTSGPRMALAAEYRSIRWTFQPLLTPGQSSQLRFELSIARSD